ncbi:hypothetical protein EB155_03240 [archaeon]|nr:hypothetical protein [archaeon]NDB54995.1 hypothetical protein [archaeon]NDB78857.1 hypothetical protein [archaeon]NDF28166.1 hypothetical protein [archaeon]
MFRTPDIPIKPRKEFNKDEYEEEVIWLKRKNDGIIKSSITSGGWVLALTTSLLLSFVFGGIIGSMIAYFTRNFISLIIPPIIVLFISIYFLKGNFSIIDIDSERKLLLYEGNIMLGGEFRSTRYRGPIEVIEKTYVVKIKRLKFLKSQPYIRFLTSSGYLRVNFDIDKEYDFLKELEKLELIDIKRIQKSLKNKSIKSKNGFLIYYEQSFDRSDFKKKMRQKIQEKKLSETNFQKSKYDRLVSSSKKFVNKENHTKEKSS